MRYNCTIHLTTEMLGNVAGKKDQRPVMLFERASDEAFISWDLAYWSWAFRQVLQAYPDVYRDAVRMDMYFKSPMTPLPTRGRRYNDNGPREKTHEYIPKGTRLNLGFELVEPEPKDTNVVGLQLPPNDTQLTDAITRIGRNIGISPFGSKAGYGRFILINLSSDSRSVPG